MANPTTYFGWVMPTATDLVTDLPADFNVFGQGVDTSMQDLLGGTTGQVLSKTSGTNMDFTWINNDQGDITGVTAGNGITVTSPTGPVPTVAIDTAITADLTTAQTLTNKNLSDSTTTIVDVTDATKAIRFDVAGTTAVTGTIATAFTTAKTVTIPDTTGTVALTNGVVNNTLTTTTGDIIYASAANTPARLGIGSASQVLSVSGGIPAWSTPAASASGLTLINSTTFSASNAINVNNVFSATYDAYKIVLTNIIGAGELAFRLRVSGSDLTTAGDYRYGIIEWGDTVAGLNYTNSGTTATYMRLIYSDSATDIKSQSDFFISGPFLSALTLTQNHDNRLRPNSSPMGFGGISHGGINNTTSYTGFSLIGVTQNWTGTVRTYGLQNS